MGHHEEVRIRRLTCGAHSLTWRLNSVSEGRNSTPTVANAFTTQHVILDGSKGSHLEREVPFCDRSIAVVLCISTRLRAWHP